MSKNLFSLHYLTHVCKNMYFGFFFFNCFINRGQNTNAKAFTKSEKEKNGLIQMLMGNLKSNTETFN